MARSSMVFRSSLNNLGLKTPGNNTLCPNDKQPIVHATTTINSCYFENILSKNTFLDFSEMTPLN